MAEKANCGHVNIHHINTQGQREKLTCDLPKGHTGDHHAVYLKNMPEHVTNEKGTIIKTVYHEEQAETRWGDMAETPVENIKAGEIEQLSEYQKDILMEVIKRTPALSTAQALAVAKLEANWK